MRHAQIEGDRANVHVIFKTSTPGAKFFYTIGGGDPMEGVEGTSECIPDDSSPSPDDNDVGDRATGGSICSITAKAQASVVRAYATKEGKPCTECPDWLPSDEGHDVLEDAVVVEPPVFSEAEAPGQSHVSMACPTSDSTPHYTLDGSKPRMQSNTYAFPLAITKPSTVTAMCAIESTSGVVTSEDNYIRVTPPAMEAAPPAVRRTVPSAAPTPAPATPAPTPKPKYRGVVAPVTFDPNGGTFTQSVAVMLSSPTVDEHGGKIVYSIEDGGLRGGHGPWKGVRPNVAYNPTTGVKLLHLGRARIMAYAKVGDSVSNVTVSELYRILSPTRCPENMYALSISQVPSNPKL